MRGSQARSDSCSGFPEICGYPERSRIEFRGHYTPSCILPSRSSEPARSSSNKYRAFWRPLIVHGEQTLILFCISVPMRRYRCFCRGCFVAPKAWLNCVSSSPNQQLAPQVGKRTCSPFFGRAKQKARSFLPKARRQTVSAVYLAGYSPPIAPPGVSCRHAASFFSTGKPARRSASFFF